MSEIDPISLGIVMGHMFARDLSFPIPSSVDTIAALDALKMVGIKLSPSEAEEFCEGLGRGVAREQLNPL